MCVHAHEIKSNKIFLLNESGNHVGCAFRPKIAISFLPTISIVGFSTSPDVLIVLVMVKTFLYGSKSVSSSAKVQKD